MTTTTLDRTEGVARLNTAIQVIRETIEESDGQFNIKMEVDWGGGGKFNSCLELLFAPSSPFISQPKVVTDVEDEELRTQMEELRLANQEVAGDDDTSDQEVAPEDQ